MDVEHHGQADDLGARFEVPERGALGHLIRLGGKVSPLKEFALTAPLPVLILERSLKVIRERLCKVT